MYLRRLGEISGTPIEIPGLQFPGHIADELGGAGRISVVEGGDCGIAVSFDDHISRNIIDTWEKIKLSHPKLKSIRMD
ncbi:MAG: hypothetical protein ACFE7I_07975 [Candidatus Hodarchaeota archaeon]